MHIPVLYVAITTLFVLAGDARADYPERTIKFISPFAEGSVTTTNARIIAEKLSPLLGTPIVMESRPLAGGTIACRTVVSAPPDGYTWLLGGTSNLVFPFAKQMPCDVIGGLVPVAFTLLSTPPVLVVRKDYQGDAHTLIAEMRKRPGAVSWASSRRNISHVAGLQFLDRAGVQGWHVWGPSEPSSLQLLIGAQKDVRFAIVLGGAARELIEGGLIRPLVLLSNVRSPFLRDIPALPEIGIQDYEGLDPNNSIWVPTQTPKPIVEKVRQMIGVAQKDPNVIAKLRLNGSVPLEGGPDDVWRWYKDAHKTWHRLVDQYGIERQ